MTRTLRQRGLGGYTLVIAISITAILFTAVMGLASVILLSLKGGANVRASNAAFYAAEGGVERALYAMVGHGPGFETVSVNLERETHSSYDPPSQLDLASEGYLRRVSPTHGSRAQFSYVVRARANRLPSGETVLQVRDQSSVTIPLSVDQTADPLGDLDMSYLLDVAAMELRVALDPLEDPDEEPEQPDYRINVWRGPQSSLCFFEEERTGSGDEPADCPGFVGHGVVAADDPDIGNPLTPFLFATRACTEGIDCDVRWIANYGYVPVGTTPGPTDSHLLLRDVDDILGPEEGGGIWSAVDTYLIGDMQGPPRGWPVVSPAWTDGIHPLPEVGGRMLADPDDEDSWLGVDAGEVVLTPLDPDNVGYIADGATVPGTLSASGPATERTNPDDYLYVDANGDGRVSAPWNLEISFTRADRPGEVLRRRLLLSQSDSCTGDDCFQTLALQALMDARYGNNALAQFVAGGDVRISIATNARGARLALLLPGAGADPEASAPDEKAIIRILGISGASRQILETTVFQEETLPVFRKTTVF